MMITVTITECKTDGNKWISQHRTNDPGVAFERAIKRHFGARRGFWRDSSLTVNAREFFGQVTEPLPCGSNNCVTDRVCVQID